MSNANTTSLESLAHKLRESKPLTADELERLATNGANVGLDQYEVKEARMRLAALRNRNLITEG